MSSTTRRLILALAFVIPLTTLISPGQRDLYIGDETKYGQIIRELEQTGSFLLPTLEGRPYSHKPPLHFWMISGLTRIFGRLTTWSYILPALLAYVLLLLLVWKMAGELTLPDAPILSVFFTATFYLSWGLAQTARMDLTYLVLISLGAFHLFHFFECGRARDLNLAALWCGLAILVKGPMAAVILLVLLILERIRRKAIPGVNFLPALLIVVAVPMLWVIPAGLAGGREYADELLVKQNLGRAVNAWVHKEPPWFHLLRLPLTLFPWFFTFLFALIAFIKERRWRNMESDSDRFLGFCTSWFFAVLIAYSALSSKLDVYMGQALVPVALICAWFVMSAVTAGDRWRRLASRANVIVALVIGLLLLVVLYIAPRFVEPVEEMKFLERASVRGLFWTAAVASVAAFAISWRARKEKLLISIAALAVAAFAPLLYLVIMMMPVANAVGSTRALVHALARENVAGPEIALYRCPHLWSGDIPATLENVRYIGAHGLNVNPRPRLVVTRAKDAADLGAALNDYEKVSQVRIRAKRFDLYRLR